MPKVSIVLPTYNAGTFLRETMETILAQTYEDFEFLILDSASTDDTIEIIKSFDDARITLTELPFVCEAPIKRNLGFSQAQGDYIMMMDADDLNMPDRLEKQVAFLDAHPDIHVLGSQYITFEDGQEDMLVPVPAKDGIIKAHFLRATGSGIHSPTVLMRRDFLLEHSIFFRVVRAGEGQIFWNDWMMAGARFANIQEPLVRYRRHGASHVHSRREAYRGARTEIREELLTLFFPHLTRAEARKLAQMMEKGRQHEISELACGVAFAEKAAEFRVAQYGADVNTLVQILADAHQRAKEKMRRVLGQSSSKA